MTGPLAMWWPFARSNDTTDPNQATQSDILEIRARMMRWLTPAFYRDVDAGMLDGFGLYRRAEAELLRERNAEECGE